MNHLKNLAAAVALTFVLGLPVLAGETSTPPAPVPPGATQGPGMPSIAPGQMPTLPEANSQTSFTELAVCVLESILPLF